MSLDKSIVIVNEFSLKTPGGGTRGGTPGDYILRYMARDGAVEAQGPALVQNIDSYVTKYMARETAAETLPRRIEAEKEIQEAGGLGGKAFSGDSLGLTDFELKRRSREIQKAFDSGKTVLKTVLSFDMEYLEQNKVLPPGFCLDHPKPKKGDFRGQVDQIRLRQAIRDGLEKIAGDYDDLHYIGVIQTDTAHVHCHLAIADFGKGNLRPDGTQTGKLSSRQKAQIRKGIDRSLDNARDLQYLASASFLEQRSLRTALVRHTYHQVLLYGAPQRLMLALPEDERLWRAGSNRKEMREANGICRDYVNLILSRKDPMTLRAERALESYADARQKREKLTDKEKQAILEKSRENMIQSCMNGVYGELKQIPKDLRRSPTDLLALSVDPAPFPDFESGPRDMIYRMGAYHSRLKSHRKEARRYDKLCRDYETAKEKNQAAPGSEALYDYFRINREYHGKVSEKYARFLFHPAVPRDLQETLLKLEEEARRVDALRKLTEDKSLANLTPNEAERLGRERYGAYGGRFAVLDPDSLDSRLRRLTESYEKKAEAAKETFMYHGLAITRDKDGSPSLQPARFYSFDDIRALDLHDLRSDFPGPLEYDDKARHDFLTMARRRCRSYDRAAAYLDATDQSDLKSALEPDDIEAMRRVMELINTGQPIPPAPLPYHAPTKKKTVYIDAGLHAALSSRISEQAYQAAIENQNNRQLGD